MADQPPAGLLEVGRVGRAHGVLGKVSFHLTSNRRERVEPGARLWIGEWVQVRSSAPVPGSDRWIISLADVVDRNAAERFVNRTVWAEPVEDDEAIWVHQVIGARVRDSSGTGRGRCRSVIANPANDLLELESGALIPVTFITSIDEDDEGGYVVEVDPPAGLFELFEETDSSRNRGGS